MDALRRAGWSIEQILIETRTSPGEVAAALGANPKAVRSWLPTRYEAGKNTDGRKHHVVTDTLGLLMVVLVTAASSKTATRPAGAGRMAMPSIVLVWADSSSVRRRPLRQRLSCRARHRGARRR